MRNTAFIFSVLLVVMLSMGCATRKEIIRFQDDTFIMRSDLDTLKQMQMQTSAQMEDLASTVRDVSAKQEYGSSTLEEKVQALTARLDDILSRMDRTLSPLEEFLRKQQGSDSNASGTLGHDYYDAAQNDLIKGNYDLAEMGFLQFLTTYPKSELADDARYGLAESYYARKMYDQAADEFSRIADKYPEGNKTPAALLKLGLTYKAQGKTKEAKIAWESLADKYGKSEEAKIAKQRLSELKK